MTGGEILHLIVIQENSKLPSTEIFYSIQFLSILDYFAETFRGSIEIKEEKCLN